MQTIYGIGRIVHLSNLSRALFSTSASGPCEANFFERSSTTAVPPTVARFAVLRQKASYSINNRTCWARPRR